MRKFAFAALLAWVCTACSTVPPQPNPRNGLIDMFGKLTPANTSGNYSARVEEEDTGPGAVEANSEDEAQIGGVNLTWPLKHVKVTSGFGKRGSEFHEGVDLHASTGTPVYAAQAGRVIYAGSKIKGYGRLIVLKHDRGISTVYAHNSRILVKHGDRVKQGQKIAMSGKSGKVSGPHLHFEIRKGVAAVDPAKVMPSTGLKASL